MESAEVKESPKVSLLLRISGYLSIVLIFLVWLLDRILHIMLPHRTHEQFTSWAKDLSNVKYTFARLFIFIIPILIFKIVMQYGY